MTVNGHDPHQAKSKILSQERLNTVSFVLAELQWGKEDIRYSLHVEPHTHGSSGIQITDFLSFLGFERSSCSFVPRSDCYFRWVDGDFDSNIFAESFDTSYSNLKDAQKELEKCGIILNQPEGWGYFDYKGSESIMYNSRMLGDGHLAQSAQLMQEIEDEVFFYKFTFLRSDYDKGWVIHYRPKRSPLSSELQSAFRFLDMQEFQGCPEYDYELCYWRPIDYVERGRGLNNAREASRCFEAHAQYFSSGIQKLLAANMKIQEVGFTFLPDLHLVDSLNVDRGEEIERPQSLPESLEVASYDVAISFAGSERKYAEELAEILREKGYLVFYDKFYREDLWGKNLLDFFADIYNNRAQYCVIFVSRAYKKGMWTTHERKIALARALNEQGKEYILPIKVDDVELDGMPSTIGYIELEMGIEQIAELLIKKLSK